MLFPADGGVQTSTVDVDVMCTLVAALHYRQRLDVLKTIQGLSTFLSTSEPQHDKTNKMSVRPAKTQISLGIRPV